MRFGRQALAENANGGVDSEREKDCRSLLLRADEFRVTLPWTPQASTRTPEGMMAQLAAKILPAILVALAACASPGAEAASATQEGQEAAPRPHLHLLRPGSCYDMGYETKGITIPIIESRSVQKRVTAYICWHQFNLVPHKWP
jgi:hypothetical protein